MTPKSDIASPNKYVSSLYSTCHPATIRDPYSTETVVGNSCNLASAPCPMVVVTVWVRVRHWVWVIRVQVITALWALVRRDHSDETVL